MAEMRPALRERLLWFSNLFIFFAKRFAFFSKTLYGAGRSTGLVRIGTEARECWDALAAAAVASLPFSSGKLDNSDRASSIRECEGTASFSLSVDSLLLFSGLAGDSV